jgi:hypothetical protein
VEEGSQDNEQEQHGCQQPEEEAAFAEERVTNLIGRLVPFRPEALSSHESSLDPLRLVEHFAV